MKIINDIHHDQHTKRSPVVLTIGFFDGMHLGHQNIFSKVRELKGEEGIAHTLTFINHPKTYLNPDFPLPLITTLEERVELIKKEECNTLILLEFDEVIKKASADEFLSLLHEHLLFDHLVLGPDATIGHNREGNTDLIQLLAKKFSFEFHLVPYTNVDKERISSSLIREEIKKGDFKKVQSLLGRPYSIKLNQEEGEQIGRNLGYPTLNLNVEGLALPPLGVYKVEVLHEGQTLLGAANLGFAPTIHERMYPVLEIHLLDFQGTVNAESVEVVFLDFIRKERKFSSMDELKEQIQSDIEEIRA